MAFDLATAKPVAKAGFDLSTAKPVQGGGAPDQAKPELSERASSQGLLRQFAHGASFGFDDELAGAVSAMTGGDYQSAKDAYARERDEYGKAHPVASFAANVAGGVGMGAGVGKVLATGAKALETAAAVPGASGALQNVAAASDAFKAAFAGLPRWAQLATVGGAAGGAQGAGDAEEGHRTAGALQGTATGAAIGAVAPAALGAAGKALDTVVGTPVRMAVNALRTPEEQGLRLAAKALNRDGVTPTELKNTLESLGPNAMLGDAGGKNTLGLVDYATQIPGKAADAGMKALEDRAKGAGGRVVGALTDSMGVKSTNFDALTQALHDNMRDVAKSHNVDEILNTGAADMTGNLPKLMEGPTMKNAIRQAYSIVGDDISLGRADRKTLDYFDVGPNGEISGTVQAPTLRVLDYAKRGLDSIINEGTDAVTGKMTSQAERAVAIKRELLKNVDNINPDYAAYRKAYADEKAGESALNLGRAFMHEDSEVTARHLADMTPAEKKYFMAGAARAVSDKIRSAPDTGMAYADFLKRPLLTDKLRAAFGDNQEAFDSFMQQLQNESRMGATFSTARGNSKSFAREAVAKDAGDPTMGGASIPLTKEGILRRLAIAATKPSDEVSGQLADLLMTTDPAKNAQTIQRLDELLPKLNRKILPEGTSRVGALLFGQQGGRLPSTFSDNR